MSLGRGILYWGGTVTFCYMNTIFIDKKNNKNLLENMITVALTKECKICEMKMKFREMGAVVRGNGKKFRPFSELHMLRGKVSITSSGNLEKEQVKYIDGKTETFD